MDVINREYIAECPIVTLHPHPQNYNCGDLDSIQESVQVNGFYGAVIVHDHPEIAGEYEILAGEHRWRTALEEGAQTVPVIVVDADPVAGARILLGDNETAKRSTYDVAALSDLLNSLESLEGTGFDLQQLSDFEDERDANEPPEEEPEPPEIQYAVVITVRDESEQQELYERFKIEGLQVRVATV